MIRCKQAESSAYELVVVVLVLAFGLAFGWMDGRLREIKLAVVEVEELDSVGTVFKLYIGISIYL